MYRYDNISFRPIDKSDLEKIRKMHNEDSTLLNLGDPTLISSTQQLEWWETISSSRVDTVYCICKKTYDNVIGVWRLQNLDEINRSCEIGADIFPEFRGQGLGKKTYKMILEYLFLHYNIHTAYVKVAEFNDVAISLYKKIGFTETGRIPESIYRHGKYWDNFIMSMTVAKYFDLLEKRKRK